MATCTHWVQFELTARRQGLCACAYYANGLFWRACYGVLRDAFFQDTPYSMLPIFTNECETSVIVISGTAALDGKTAFVGCIIS